MSRREHAEDELDLAGAVRATERAGLMEPTTEAIRAARRALPAARQERQADVPARSSVRYVRPAAAHVREALIAAQQHDKVLHAADDFVNAESYDDGEEALTRLDALLKREDA